MKKYILKIIVLTLTLTLCSCDDWGKDDELTFGKSPYTGSELKTNGYYYRENQHENGDIYYEAYFLYRDGTILYADYFPKNDALNKEEDYNNLIWINGVKKYKYRWGVFKIESNNIIYEMWNSVEGALPAYHWSGTILNDTTYLITKSCRVNNKECRGENYLYHFKAFSPKPDSTNVFVK